MLKRLGLLSLVAGSILGSDVVLAASDCDWTATRKRNDAETVCYETLGPKTPGFSFTDPVKQDKLEQCLLRTKETHLLERAKCAEKSEMMAAEKRKKS